MPEGSDEASWRKLGVWIWHRDHDPEKFMGDAFEQHFPHYPFPNQLTSRAMVARYDAANPPGGWQRRVADQTQRMIRSVEQDVALGRPLVEVLMDDSHTANALVRYAIACHLGRMLIADTLEGAALEILRTEPRYLPPLKSYLPGELNT